MTEFEQPKRRRGRPSNAELQARRAAESTDPGYVTVEGAGPDAVGSGGGGGTSRQQETKARRRRRDDSGETLNRKLFIPERFLDRSRFAYRWINDKANGRIQDKTVFDDWDIVTTKDLGPEYQLAAKQDSNEATPIRRVVGSENNIPLYAYFCKKPIEFHEEDQKKKQRVIEETEEAMRRGPLPSSEGLQEGEVYVPKDHRNVISGR